jgi:ribonuclease P protein component
LTQSAYQRVFDKALFRVKEKHFLILACPGSGSGARLGLVVGKKHIRQAHSRNNIKRVVREAFRHEHHGIPEVDIIFIARSGLEQLPNKDLREKLAGFWKSLVINANEV